MQGGMGFIQPNDKPARGLQEKVERTAVEAARRKFSPEVMNRLDKIVVFHPLKCEELDEVLEIENVFPIYLPPLRERKPDIPELVEYFVQQFAASMDKSIESIPQETMRSLVRHHWPGNIRELQNYIARGVILSNDGVFEPAPLESYEQSEPEISNPTL